MYLKKGGCKIVLNYNKLFWTSKLQTCSSFLSTKVEQRPEPCAGDTPSTLSWIWESGCRGWTGAVILVCNISASHTPLCIHQDQIVLHLCTRLAALTLHRISRPPCHMWCSAKGRVVFRDPLKFILDRTGRKSCKVREEQMTMILKKLFRISVQETFHCFQNCFLGCSCPSLLYF